MRQRGKTAIVCAAAAVLLLAPVLEAQLSPLRLDQGATGLGLALRRLGVTGRVLCVFAHPDDENNGMLIRLSRIQGLRVGVLTLTRGEGGQNELGPELFDALGVLRTEELMATHRYDGAEQVFGRSFEFGYSYGVEETFQKWGREETLGDVVRGIRVFRPDVILTLRFEAPGGGQHHQAAAQLTREAFRAAADPARYPEQIQAGLRPWQARKLYQTGAGTDTADAVAGTVKIHLGGFDPLLGRSPHQLGSLARAAHRSQGVSQLEAAPGEGSALFLLADSEPPVATAEGDVMDGVDTTLKGLLRLAPSVDGLLAEIQAVEARAGAARAAFDPSAPEKTLPSLQGALEGVRRLQRRVRESPGGGGEDAAFRLADEERDVEAALALAHGLSLDVSADDDRVVPGQSFTVTAAAWNQGRSAVGVQDLELAVPEGWTARRTSGAPGNLDPGQGVRFVYTVTASPQARLSRPYWHRVPGRDRLLLDVAAHEGLPWSPPDVVGRLRYLTGGMPAALERPVAWRYEGPGGGEKQKVVAVVPALSVRLSPRVTAVPTGPARTAREYRVTVTNDVKGPASAAVQLELPQGWTVEPAQAAIAFRHEGEEMAARFQVTAPAGLAAGAYPLRAVARLDGREYREGYQVIAYEHVQTRHLYRPAEATALALDVKVAPGVSIGYVRGAGDEVGDALRQLGVPVTFLSADDLAFGDLSRYTTIMTGIRAYQTRPDLRSYHHRLRRFMEDGGHLVVQYHKLDFNQLVEPPRVGGFTGQRAPGTAGPRVLPDSPYAPYPASVTQNRVSDEAAPVTVLAPGHRLLTSPNVLGAPDWEGWVQERGLYFLDARDPRYVDLLSMRDPFPNNPGEKKGALVEAPVGKGSWTYVGLGLFRQLPAGVPGAYRLLANLVSRPRGT
jgi:LmbE family N-acetylglucosaminyl deacetylase